MFFFIFCFSCTAYSTPDGVHALCYVRESMSFIPRSEPSTYVIASASIAVQVGQPAHVFYATVTDTPLPPLLFFTATDQIVHMRSSHM